MRVLHAIHDFLPRHCAGSEIYAFELARTQQAMGHECHVLCAEYDPQRLHGTLDWRSVDGLPVTELVNNWRFDDLEQSYRSPEIARQLDSVLDAVQPDVVHIHNLLNLSFELPKLAAARGMTRVATLHEYVLVCASGGQRVHLAEQHVCNEIDVERCARCFVQSPFYSQMAFARVAARVGGMGLAGRVVSALRTRFPGFLAKLGNTVTAQAPGISVTPSDIQSRLQAVKQVYDSIELFVAPSPSLGAEFVRFGLPAAKLKVSDYGFVPMRTVPRAAAPDGCLRVGFIGTLVWHKGAHILMEAVSGLPHDRIDVQVFGSQETFPDYAAGLRELAAGTPVRFLGGFDRSRVPEVYAGLDVVVISSLWPENSPLVIHEAFQAGVPVVGARMGGIVDLVRDGENGLLYDAFSADALAACLTRLLDEPGLLGLLAANIPPVKSIAEDAAEWVETYRSVRSTHDR
jgi:glycosyltransferase involved in cell wall biosynthesis